MLQRTLFAGLQVLAGLLAGIIIVVLVCVWLISRGPVSLALVEEHVSGFLNTTFPEIQLSFEDTVITWAGWERAVNFEVLGLSMQTADGGRSLVAPNVSFSLSVMALLNGVIAPSNVVIAGPTITVTLEPGKSYDAEFNLAVASVTALATGRLENVLRRLSNPRQPDDPIGFLNTIVVEDADIIVNDEGKNRSWVTPHTQLRLARVPGGVEGETSFLVDLGSSAAEVSIVASYDNASERVDAGISFGDVVPSELSETLPQLGVLDRLQLPMTGTLTISSSVRGELEGISIDVEGGRGRILLLEPLQAQVAVEHASVQGRYDAQTGVYDLSSLEIKLAANTELLWAEPVHHAFPVEAIRSKARYRSRSDVLEVDGLVVALDGFDAQVTGSVENLLEHPSADINIDVNAMTVADLKKYWPKSALNNTQHWISTNIFSGNLSNVRAQLFVEENQAGSLDVSSLLGSFDLSDIDLRYAEEMPRVTGLKATASFDLDRFDFDVMSAQSAEMDVTGGTVSLLDISTDVAHAKISVNVEGDFDKAMTVIDRAPQGFASAVGVDPGSVVGETSVALEFAFPLLNDPEWEDFMISAKASIEEGSIPGGLFGFDVSDANLEVGVNNEGMSIAGDLFIENFPGRLSWYQNFNREDDIKNIYKLAVEVQDVRDISDLGIDLAPVSPEMIKGTVPLQIDVVEYNDGVAEVEAIATLDIAELRAPVINWLKPRGVTGIAKINLNLVNGLMAYIPKFRVKTDNLQIEGRISYDRPGGRLARIDIENVEHGRTRMTGLLAPGTDGVWEGNFRGDALDLAPVWDDITEGDLLSTGESLWGEASVSVQFGRVWLSENNSLRDVAGVMSRSDDIWRSVYLTSVLSGGEALEVKLAPSAAGNARILTVWSPDAGDVLRILDVYDNMAGGELSLSGRFDDSIEDAPLSGELDIQGYQILRAPTLAQMLSILALTGIVDALQGDGLAFDRLTVPFTYSDGLLELREARATGASLGFTASGSVFTQVDYLDLNGTIVPIYALNSLLGNIPLVGTLFSGGEEGGGLFAANYTINGNIEEPEITINPLSVLTPGFLRNIFSSDNDSLVPREKESGQPVNEP